MKTPLVVLSVLLVCHGATAQEMPVPSPELQKFAPLIGSWHGTGTAQMGPGAPSKWESKSTCTWALGNFFVQEDIVVTFEDMPKPLVMRNYFGWDAEGKRLVAVGIDNDGAVGVDRVEFTDDGSMVTTTETFHEGHRYIERYTSRIDGDEMSFAIDMMGATGASSSPVRGKMKRTDKGVATALSAGSFTATPAPAIVRLGKSAGTFAVKATMIMMPDTPRMDITGTDVVEPRFGGTVVHVRTTGSAEGHPGEYQGELFYGFDAQRDCIRAVYVSNMGEVGEMTGTFTPDNKSFVLASAMRYMGQPSVQRMVMHFDDSGAPTRAIGHTMLGTSEPYESWNATYTRK